MEFEQEEEKAMRMAASLPWHCTCMTYKQSLDTEMNRDAPHFTAQQRPDTKFVLAIPHQLEPTAEPETTLAAVGVKN